jgi:hypothetical protein
MKTGQRRVDVPEVDPAPQVVGCSRLDRGDKVLPARQASPTGHPRAGDDDQSTIRIHAGEFARKCSESGP